jgi:hypothetical protein
VCVCVCVEVCICMRVFLSPVFKRLEIFVEPLVRIATVGKSLGPFSDGLGLNFASQPVRDG